jgi:hypothetical protein
MFRLFAGDDDHQLGIASQWRREDVMAKSRPRTKRNPAADAPTTVEATPALPTADSDLAERRLERIARRAREIYEARGGEHGQALDDWLQAEREIDAELEDPIVEDDEDEP